MLAGMANPMPEPPRTIAVLMPITSPRMFTSGPPELPGLMAASVCKKSSYGPAPICRALALTMPEVTVACSPNGEPTARTQSPTCTSLESPSGRNGNFLPVGLQPQHRQVSLLVETHHVALCLVPSSIVTSTWVAPSTTCALVNATPEGR